MNVKIHKHTCRSKGRRIWRYAHADWVGACEAIDEINLDDLVMTENIDDAWEAWMQQFMSIMNQFIPICTLRSTRNLFRLTKPLIKLIKKRQLLYKSANKSGNFRNYKIALNRTMVDIRLAKLTYFRKLNPRDPKKFGRLSSLSIKSRRRCQH